MLRRRKINADTGERGLRPLWTAAADVLRDVGGFLEEHVLWRVADLLRGRAETLRWPLERFAWLIERRLVWPLQERAAGRSPSSPAAGAGALAAVALAAGVVGVLSISGGDSDRGTAASPIVVRTATAPAQPAPAEPDGPALEGFPPSFGTGGVAAASGDSDQVTVDSSIPGATADPAGATGAAEGAAATSSSEKPVPAGPAAMKVARRFAEAFVFYEIGERPARAAVVFSETATPRLATALAERPPRLPESARVPKARVLNLVPGPRRGKAYTVSASLLRVGVTSELRLQMKRQAGNWVVTDVRG
jgi:hypothetical protein